MASQDKGNLHKDIMNSLRRCLNNTVLEYRASMSDGLVLGYLLAILDIFRGLRKYCFLRKKYIEKELPHLRHQTVPPGHYPKYIRDACGYHTNPFYMTDEAIINICTCMDNVQMKSTDYSVFGNALMYVSENFFG